MLGTVEEPMVHDYKSETTVGAVPRAAHEISTKPLNLADELPLTMPFT
jgi:hypothetical protein